MKKKLIVVVIVFLALISVCAYKIYERSETGITATGTIEITKADIAAKVNGYMLELNIKEGDTVTAGQVIARINRKDLEAQLAVDEKTHAKAQIQLNDLLKGARTQEVIQASANLNSADAVYKKAKDDLERYEHLYTQGAIAKQQLDSSKSSYDVAFNALLTAKAQQDLVLEGNRPDIIEAQKIEVERTKAMIAATKAVLGDTILRSPINGTVLTKNYEQGEYINVSSAIATIGNLEDCWVKIYISSEELGKIKLDQEVNIRIDAYPERIFKGVIKEISQNAEFTPRQSITKKERANLVFYVKVKVDNNEGILKPGMPADVIIK